MNAPAFWSGVLLGAIIVIAAFGADRLLASDPQPTDIETLCAPYGGVRGNDWSKETKRYDGRESYAVSVTCKDGSWIMRGYDK